MGALARVDLRRRWRGLVLLALLLGVSAAVALGAFAGARRTATAFERFGAATNIADAEVLITDFDLGCSNPAAGDADHVAFSRTNLARLRALPSVAAASVYRSLAVRPAGSDLAPLEDVVGRAYVDGRSAGAVDRWIVHRGRLPSPEEAGEAMLNRTAASELGLEVGDDLPLESVPDDIVFGCDLETGVPETNGPRATVRIVGIGTIREEVTSGADAGSAVALTPAFLDRYGNDISSYDRALVRLRDGAAGLDELTSELSEAYGPGTIRYLVTPSDQLGTRQVEDAVSLQAVALVVFGSVVAVAAALAVGQGLARQLDRPAEERTALRACGVAPHSVTLAAGCVGALVGLAGTAVAVAGGVAASSWLPFGLAGRAEPDPGVDVDGVVLLGGSIAIVVLTGALAGALETIAGRRARRRADPPRAHDSRTLGWLRRAGLPVAALTGARFAVQPDRSTAASVRSALVGVAVGVAGVTAVVVFGASLARLLDEPERYGQPYDVDIAVGIDPLAAERVVAALRADDSVRDVAVARIQKAVQLDGISTQAYGFADRVGHIEPTILDGRPATSAAEIVLAPDTLAELGVAIGDTVTAVGGTPERSLFTVVGVGLLPNLDSDLYTEGAILTGAGMNRLSFPNSFIEVIATTPGADPDRVRERLEDQDLIAFGGGPPAEIDNLHDVEDVPFLLALFLSMLAVTAIAHGLVMTVRRRRADLAVLRSLGFERSQVSLCVVSQAVTIAIIGLTVGVVAGLALGGWLWSLQADRLQVLPVAETSIVVVGAVVAGTLALGVLAAWWPARRAARVEPAVLLRDR